MSLKIVNVADGFESSSVPGVAEVIGQKIYYRDITNGEFIAMAVVLPSTPAVPGNVTLTWQGITQTIDKDFYVDGSSVKWDGKNLESVMQPNDEILVTYQ